MGDVTMHSHRRQARLAGVLYLIATLAIVASGPFVGSTDSLSFLTEAAADENQVMLGTLFQLAAGTTPAVSVDNKAVSPLLPRTKFRLMMAA